MSLCSAWNRRAGLPLVVLFGLAASLACGSLATAGDAAPKYGKVLFLGNSITLHVPAPAIGWTGNWGMAASAKEKDFVHLITAALAKKAGAEPTILVKNIAAFERQFATFDAAAQLKDAFDFQADLVVVAIGENVPNLATAEMQTQFRAGLTKLLEGLTKTRRPKLVVRSGFWPNKTKDQILADVCKALGGVFVDIGSLSKDEANYARAERDYQHKGVAAHPGDKGMQAIATAILQTLDGPPARATITTWPAPAGEALADDYQLKVDGQPVPVYACRVSAVPFNQVWPGYQRPLEQTELAGFACWDMTGSVQVEVQTRNAAKVVVVRPVSLGIRPTVAGNRISFSLPRAQPVVVEVDGPHRALHLFAGTPEKDAPAANAPGVRYFGPGVHRPGKIELKSDETVYLAGGAVVYGSIQATNAKNIRVAGRGILDVGPFERGKGGGAVRLSGCTQVSIEGIVMRDPDVWCCSLFGCSQATIANVKLVGLWRYNADGIDVCNSQNVVVRDSFVRAFDDALVVKGLKNVYDAQPVRDVRFERCVIWCDWGRALEIGAETCAPEIADVVFRDCDIVRTTHIAMDIQHGDRAAIRNIRFDNIRVEVDQHNPRPRLQKNRDDKFPGNDAEDYCPTLLEIVIRKTPYSKDSVQGTVRDVVFNDIRVFGRLPLSSFRGFSAEAAVEGVTIQNLRCNDQPLGDVAAARLAVGPHVRGVRVLAAAADAKPK